MPKISALTSLAQADVVTTTDVLPIVDATAPATTKKVTVQAMVNAGLATLTTLPSGIVNASLNSIAPIGGALSIGSAAGAYEVRVDGNTVIGAALLVRNNSVPVICIANKSAIFGGAYDATPMLYGNAPIEVNQALNVTGFISVIGSMGWIDVNDSRAAGVGVGGSLFLRGKDDNGDYQDFAGINAFLTNGTVGAVGADLIFKTSLSGTLAERMRLLSSGDLLINQTTNPSSYKLAVTGNVGFTGSFIRHTGGGGDGYFGAGTALVSGAATGTMAVRSDYGDLLFSLAATEKARISSTGLSVTGLTTTDTLRVNVTPTAETPTATHTAVFNINGTNYKFLCLAA